ncbi:hypothetical protein K402DRAFT_321545 [Aulographum hederae CBS 113979]|uniref:Proteasome activator subunit 4 n=1 Tax=Aulographum hederae CBS 113979 TaxID=1176131 RepID=A0A6G1HFY7_9PEZI|nr:hypothetical protein K402DRAFT_321545 [Aulographum hederae CBS 113979]
MAANERVAELMSMGSYADLSRSTTPGDWNGINGSNGQDEEEESKSRSRPRTFPYLKHLPYNPESEEERLKHLDVCLQQLYIAVSAGDFTPGVVHWTREIRGWLTLKFDMPRETRIKLVNLYYELALAPGLDYLLAERFASMFMTLLKRKHYIRPGKDLILDWRPLFRELKLFVLPSEAGAGSTATMKRNIRTITKMCTFAQSYFDTKDIPAMLEEFLPYFSTSFAEGAYVVVGLLNLLFPTHPPETDNPELSVQHYLPTFFHLWALVNRSKTFDVVFLDILSRLARDQLTSDKATFSAYGLFTEEQSSLIFTAILRTLEIPVGQTSSAYASTIDYSAGLGVMLDRDSRKHPVPHHIARWIVMSLSPASLDKPNSVLANLEGLIQAVETFFHPSNTGNWTKPLSQLVNYLSDFFVMRWNREQSGEMDVPEDRKLNNAIKRRFVLCLRDVIFMGIFSKSGTAVNFSLNTLHRLAYLEPNLILPGALQRIYPAMKGLVEVHRTISAIRALQMLTRVMAKTKGYRCHITSLLGLALPGIDPNDLDKTVQTLAYIQAVSYNIPLHDLTKEVDLDARTDERGDGAETPVGDDQDTGIAIQWITEQVERLELETTGLEVDYDKELTDADEEKILRSSTTGLSEFLLSFLGRVFTLLENLPDAARVRSGSPEELIMNTLPAAFLPLLASLSDELYDVALNKIAHFVMNHVIHQARDAMAFICNAFVKVNPEKALSRLIPDLISAIRTEIEDNGAASTRTTGSEVYPRDRALVWNISLLSMCVVHVGKAVMMWKDDLFDIAIFMQQRCKGVPTVHVSNFIHHLLLNVTVTYTVDFSIYDKKQIRRGLSGKDWGHIPDPQSLNIFWHVADQEEIEFAIHMFQTHATLAIKQLNELTGEQSPIKRDGTGKDWSDEVSRNLGLLRLIISGVSVLFDSQYEEWVKSSTSAHSTGINGSSTAGGPDADVMEVDAEPNLGESEDEEFRPTFQYETGYPLTRGSEPYKLIHEIRSQAGETFNRVHDFLVERQQDDVQCFSSLYSAYRSWFIDVGIEKSAHVLDRVTRLLAGDIQPFRFSGLRKQYPRPLLVRRASVYHLQRLRHNANPRPRTELDMKLLMDLARSSVSLYTEIRRTAQSANESAVKCIVGARPLVIPPLLEALTEAVRASDFPRIKGALFSLLFGSLAKTIQRDWRFTPTLIKAFIDVTGADKPSVQKLAGNATYQIMDMGKPLERLVILDESVVKAVAPVVGKDEATEVMAAVEKKQKVIKAKRTRVEDRKAALALELIEFARKTHWKVQSRTAAIVMNLGMRYETIASPEMIDLVTLGSIDPHPSLRALYGTSLAAIYSMVDARSITGHDYQKFLLAEEKLPDRIEVPTRRYDPNWTAEHLASFAQPEASYYVDADHPGWLVWKDKMPAFKPNPDLLEFDEVEQSVRKQIGKHLDRQWFSTYFAFMKQEPRDSGSDRLRMAVTMLLTHHFELMFHGDTSATFEDLKELTASVYGDGSDKHQHRATAEIMSAFLTCAPDLIAEQRTAVWEYCFPIVRGVFKDGLTPENTNYWTAFLHVLLSNKDPRRSWPLVDWLSSFRLDMSSNAAFKESSKISALHQVIIQAGWHYQLEKPILEDFMQHLDHPYKGVREAMGQIISSIYRTRYHESYPDLKTLMEAQKSASSIGIRPYQPTAEFEATIKDVFEKLEKWRGERAPGQQTPSSYTSGGKTILLWLDTTLQSFECVQLISFFPQYLIEQLLHMMDIREDPELQSLAYHVFRHLPNIPLRQGEDDEFIQTLIHVGRNSKSWHQRLRILINIQIVYFRRLFLMSATQQQNLFDCVTGMLSDPQHEVRQGAAATLSGMIRCSPIELRDKMIRILKDQFADTLRKNPLPKRRAGGGGGGLSTPTPEHKNIEFVRHSAVLGLGALVQAFPYTSPPPMWLPDVLATLALRAAGDPGVVGKSVKTILADFKKTRQDTWHVDVKAFEPEQLEDLEGVLWKSYFA